MIYGKLPVAFLGAIASEKNGTTNSAVAAYMLEHLEDVQGMNITELANACHVSSSTISRFCKEIGFDSYAELREVLQNPEMFFERQTIAATSRERANITAGAIINSIEMVKNSLNFEKVQKLCSEIARYKRVAAFGLLKAGAAAIDLQCDLLMLGKYIYTNISYPQQMEYILSSGADDLIMIFSYTGSYFEYQEHGDLDQLLRAPRIWMVSGKRKKYPPYIKDTLLFTSIHDQPGHPYQLQTAASIIAQEYALLQTK